MIGSNNKIKTRKNSLDLIKNTIEANILSGKYIPKQRLIEEDIARELGVSRTPVRESLKQLEAKGLVSRLPSRRLVVASVTAEDIRNTFEVRESLECLAAELACERASQKNLKKAQSYLAKYSHSLKQYLKNKKRDYGTNSEPDWNELFHNELYAASGNSKLVAYIQDIRDVQQLTYVSHYFRPDDFYLFYEQHNNILSCIRNRDKEKARQAVQEHLRTIQQFYLKYYQVQ